MYILFVVKYSGAVDGGDADLVPLDVVHVILVDAELRAGERDPRHLVLQRGDVEGTGDHMVQE